MPNQVLPSVPSGFQSTLPVRGATTVTELCEWSNCYFNPRSPCGERLIWLRPWGFTLIFQSTLPVRGATYVFGNILSGAKHFNPRSPCGERRRGYAGVTHCTAGFQSTLPVRGATRTIDKSSKPVTDFNPRSPCGERLFYFRRFFQPNYYFNPRSPCGERPVFYPQYMFLLSAISIHAPRAGSDLQTLLNHVINKSISIHAPRAGSDSTRGKMGLNNGTFQSTLPVRGAT